MSPQRSLHLEAVVLAAGLSRRAGTFKPVVEIDGRPLLRHAVDGLRPWCRRVVVVTGHEQERARAAVAGLSGVVTVHNPRFADDMFGSVQVGTAAVTDTADGFLVLPVDCPFVEAEVYGILIGAFSAHGRTRAVVPEHAGRGGHPVLLPAAARAGILAAPPGLNLRGITAACQPLRVAVDHASVLADLDTAADLAELRARGL